MKCWDCHAIFYSVNKHHFKVHFCKHQAISHLICKKKTKIDDNKLAAIKEHHLFSILLRPLELDQKRYGFKLKIMESLQIKYDKFGHDKLLRQCLYSFHIVYHIQCPSISLCRYNCYCLVFNIILWITRPIEKFWSSHLLLYQAWLWMGFAKKWCRWVSK